MANRIKGITVEIGGDTTGLDKALKGVQSTLRTTQTSLRDVNKLLKLDPSNTELLSQKQRLLKDAIGATKDKLETLKTAQIQAKQQLENGTLGQDKYDALQREIVETEQELRRLQEEAARTNTTLAKISEAGGKLENAGNTIAGAGRKMMGVTTVIGGLGTAAVKTAADFDTSMSKVAAVSGATGKDLEALRDKAREMGAKTKFSASEAAEAMNYMAMAGWKTEDMLLGIDGIMNLAAASGEDLATTSDIVTDALTAFGLTAKNSGHFADILAAASSNANTNISMMGETFKYCAPIAGALGFSAEDTAEAIGLMANAGIKSSQAGTSLRSIMNNLTGDIKLSGAALGDVTIATTNADGSMRGLSDILADCRGAFSRLSESEKANAAESLVGKNAMSGFLALMNAAPADIAKLTGAIDNCDGASARMADTMQDNLAGQLTILKSQLQELAIAFGEILMPVIRSIVSHVQAFIDKLNGMDEGTKQSIVKIALLVAAIGPLLIIIGTTVSKVGTAMKAFSSLAQGIMTLSAKVGGMSGLMGKLGAAIGGISAPVVAVVAVVGTLAAAFVHLWNTNEGFREAIIGTWNRIKETISGFCQGIVDRLNALGFSFKDITDVIKTVWNGLCQFLAPVFEGVFNHIADILSTVTGVIIGILDVFIGLFTGNWSQMWNGIKGISGNTITIGASGVTLTSASVKQGQNISALEEDILGQESKISTAVKDASTALDATHSLKENIHECYSEISKTAEEINLSVREEYISRSELEAIQQDFETSITQNTTEIRFDFTQVTDEIKGTVADNQSLLEEYIRFKGALIELGRVGNAFTAELSGESLAFKENGQKIAYISNQSLVITNAEIRNKLSLGNESRGWFDFIPRANGNLSIKWRGPV